MTGWNQSFDRHNIFENIKLMYFLFTLNHDTLESPYPKGFQCLRKRAGVMQDNKIHALCQLSNQTYFESIKDNISDSHVLSKEKTKPQCSLSVSRDKSGDCIHQAFLQSMGQRNLRIEHNVSSHLRVEQRMFPGRS